MATDTCLTFSSQLQFLKQNISSPFDMLADPIESGLRRKRALLVGWVAISQTLAYKKAAPCYREALKTTLCRFHQ